MVVRAVGAVPCRSVPGAAILVERAFVAPQSVTPVAMHGHTPVTADDGGVQHLASEAPSLSAVAGKHLLFAALVADTVGVLVQVGVGASPVAVPVAHVIIVPAHAAAILQAHSVVG